MRRFSLHIMLCEDIFTQDDYEREGLCNISLKEKENATYEVNFTTKSQDISIDEAFLILRSKLLLHILKDEIRCELHHDQQ